MLRVAAIVAVLVELLFVAVVVVGFLFLVVGCAVVLMRCVVARAVDEFLFEPNHDLAGALPQLPISKKKKKNRKEK